MKTFNLSGGIGVDIDAKTFQDILTEAGGDSIEISLSSLGGYVDSGFAIFNLVRDYPASKTIVLDGYVASIASYIAMAFDRVIARDNTAFMIHNAWGGTFGDHEAMRHYADHLENLTGIIAGSYQRKTKKDKQELLEMMNEETWLYGQEVVDSGFADELRDTDSNEDREAVVARASRAYAAFKPPVRHDDVLKAVAMVSNTGVELKEIERARELVSRGMFDAKTDMRVQDGIIQDGRVSRSVLRQMLSHADVKNKAELASLMSEIDRRKDKTMNKAEALALLKNLRENGDITLLEIAKNIGLESQVLTEDMKSALAASSELAKLGVTDPVSEIKNLRTVIEKTAADRVENRLRQEFDPDGQGDKNALLIYARNMLKSKAEAELDEAIKAFKEDPVAKKLAAENANVFSEANRIGVGENRSGASAPFTSGQPLQL